LRGKERAILGKEKKERRMVHTYERVAGEKGKKKGGGKCGIP